MARQRARRRGNRRGVRVAAVLSVRRSRRIRGRSGAAADLLPSRCRLGPAAEAAAEPPAGGAADPVAPSGPPQSAGCAAAAGRSRRCNWKGFGPGLRGPPPPRAPWQLWHPGTRTQSGHAGVRVTQGPGRRHSIDSDAGGLGPAGHPVPTRDTAPRGGAGPGGPAAGPAHAGESRRGRFGGHDPNPLL